jgi:hypothetical protein
MRQHFYRDMRKLRDGDQVIELRMHDLAGADEIAEYGL